MPSNPLNIPEEVIEDIRRSLPDMVEETIGIFKKF